MHEKMILTTWSLGRVELTKEQIKELAEEVGMDCDESDTEAPFFIRMINISDLDNLDELRELSFVSVLETVDEEIKKWNYRNGK